MRRTAAVAGIITLAAVISGCGGSSRDTPKAGESAADAAQRQTRFLNDGAFGKQWNELHPAQQAAVDRQRYVNCAQALPRTAGAIRLLETRDEAIALDDVPEKQASVVVLKTGDRSTTTTAREVRVNDRWRWVLANGAYRALKDGRCPQ